MQKRHKNREQYFTELAQTSERHLIPYLQQFHSLDRQAAVIELSFGNGGNLLPFAQKGCQVVGIDLSPERIADAQRFFQKHNAKESFFVANVTQPLENMTEKFNIILCHNVI